MIISYLKARHISLCLCLSNIEIHYLNSFLKVSILANKTGKKIASNQYYAKSKGQILLLFAVI